MKIKSFFQDILGSARVTKRRSEAIKRASDIPDGTDPIGDVARLLHPGKFNLKIVSIRDASKSAKTFTFESETGHIPYFKAGQFLTLEFHIGKSLVTRPYSISSAPYQTRGEHPIVEITVRKSKGDGFISDYLYHEAKIGDVFLSEVGLGQFFYEPLRDAGHVLALAGGSGITPFVSMAKEIKNGKLDVDLTILYGSVSEDDIILKDELDACLCDKVHVIHVLSGDNPDWKGEKGLLDAKLIKKYSSRDTSYFICGPQAMYTFLQGELKKLEVPERRIRFEVFGQPKDVTKMEGYPKEKKDKVYEITICRGIKEDVISARADEPIAVSLERAGMKIHTACRSGSCGFCRIKVLEGKYFVCKVGDGRRAADKDFDYVHACSTYPISDMKIRINID